MHQIRFRLQGFAQTPLGELTALPQVPQLDLRGLLLREGRAEQGRAGEGKGEGREGGKGRGRMEREEGRGEGIIVLEDCQLTSYDARSAPE